MEIQQIQQMYASTANAGAFIQLLDDPSRPSVLLQGLMTSAAPLFFAGVHSQLAAGKGRGRVVLFILNDADEAKYFYHDLMQMMGTGTGTGSAERLSEQRRTSTGTTASASALFFPSSYRRAVKYGQRDAANEIARTEVLSRLTAFIDVNVNENVNESLYVVTCPEAVAELVVSQQRVSEQTISLRVGQTVDLVALEATLRERGFHETDYVYEPGQFAVRGSILDVFSYSCELPFRIDFFGDEIDTIRTFEVEDQLSRDRKESVEIVPELATTSTQKIPFTDFLPDGTVVAMKDFDFLRDSITEIYQRGFSSQVRVERMEGATEMEQQEILREMQSDNQLVTGATFADGIMRFQHVFFGKASMPTGTGSAKHLSEQRRTAPLQFHISPQPMFHKNFDILRTTLDDYVQHGYTIYILADSEKQQQRLKEILSAATSASATAITFTPVNKTVHDGFVDHDQKACLFTDHQIFDRFHKYNLKTDKARSGKMALTMKELQEMEPGDFIVHVDFGIGKFAGLVRVPVPVRPGNANHPSSTGYQEAIRLIYQRGDIVDVSIHSLYKISKYRRGDSGEPPRLSTLGTGAWERLKEKTKTRIKDIARDLIRLYAKRAREKGFAYSPDSFLQHELEASFLYEDTPDQLRATTDVKADMEKDSPMDRLVCGDVGFGKTEVAVRAAFKAACDSKQVAVLVPTTVLAFQHYQTFRDRLRDMPVRVDYLSRARSAKTTREIMQDLADGKIDILIGTHKLLGKTVRWKDLGLLIIDEEQKFGVSTKEKLRKLKTNVDTLTMSATPIPRTLQFSLMGARDMSIIRTPPPNRYPIQTEIASFGHEVIADAISFEMSRNGQVYFVNDNIKELDHIATLIHKYVPDARVAIGHGRMKPEELEKIILDFINYDYDVLLSTTIVENGIDIPNANTIIINDAHRFGLSDLHQMRGRVGRSNRKAFCYLLAPPLSALSTDARRRLEALETFSDLGSGFSLAMQDLDIRGAGNLLGAEQSGFMEDLGYETYLKIIKQAMAELRNEASAEPSSLELCLARTKPTEGQLRNEASAEPPTSLPQPLLKGGEKESQETAVGGGSLFVADCSLESDLEMYFPETYVPGSSERMLLYRELDNIETDEALDAYRRRLEDRFGPVPQEGQELMRVIPLCRIGKQLGCEKIILKQGRMQMQFVSNLDSPYYQSAAFDHILNFIGRCPRRCQLKEINGKRSMVVTDVETIERAVEVLRDISGS